MTRFKTPYIGSFFCLRFPVLEYNLSSRQMSAAVAPAGVAPHYIRLKRHKQTVFLHCDVHHDTVQALKERVEKLTGRPWMQIRLLLGKQVLDNFSTLYDCGIESEDGELNMTYLISTTPGGEELWEELDDALSGAAEGAQPGAPVEGGAPPA